MQAIAMRASTQNVMTQTTTGNIAATASTNGTSSSAGTAGEEPIPAPARSALLGTLLLHAAVLGIENTGFLYNSQWYARFAEAGGIDTNDAAAVQKRVVMATYAQIVAHEREFDDFVVQDIRQRRVDPVADRDLLTVNPGALYYFDVVGMTGTGEIKSIPSVMNVDGAVYVDPRLTGGR